MRSGGSVFDPAHSRSEETVDEHLWMGSRALGFIGYCTSRS